MENIKDFINLWDSWKPSENFVCPSQVAHYYWEVYMATNKNKPFFPSGEINDVAAVFAGTKPAAIINVDKNNRMLKKFIQKCKKYQINCKITNDTLVFSKENILDKIELALKNNNKFALGILLGYPQKSVLAFIKKNHNIVKASIKPLDKNYIKKLTVPKFIPSKKWFQ